MSLRVFFADRKEGVGWGGTESDSADARLSSVNGPVCQLTVPLLIQHNPVANATTILKRLLRTSELLRECHMLGLLTYPGHHIKTPIFRRTDIEDGRFVATASAAW